MLNNFRATVSMTFRDTLHAREENRRLKSELAALILQQQRYEEILLENKRLKEILSLKNDRPDYVATAKVISRGYGRLLNTLVINKGANDGIKKDMAVITTAGLVGKIDSVRNNFSEVLLLTDPNFSVAVRLQHSRRKGIVSGAGHKYCLMKYIPPEESVDVGEAVLTSGLDGIFPAGLPVGIVYNIDKEGIEFFQDIQVLPFQDNAKIEEVVILSK
jgi:rod shape-determining protein MreC